MTTTLGIPGAAAAPTTRAPVLELRGVSKHYPGPPVLQVLRDVDLTVTAGEMLAITGPSGSGKSTLLHIMGTLDLPSSGTMHVDGTDVGALLNLGSGMSMPCWRMHRAKSSAACRSSWLPPGLVVAVGLLAPLRLATPLALPPPPQAATASVKASMATSTASRGRQRRRGGRGGRAGPARPPWSCMGCSPLVVAHMSRGGRPRGGAGGRRAPRSPPGLAGGG
jgi:energy-coupling factor transporter ATP-binding protein EcfA2